MKSKRIFAPLFFAPILFAQSLFVQLAFSPISTWAQEDAIKTMTAMEQVLVNAIEKSEKSIVAISRVRNGSIGDPTDPNFVPNEFGTGVVIDEKGFIVTNYHLLGDIDKNSYYVWASKKPYRVIDVERVKSVKAADPWTDLAVLQIESDDLKPITFGDGSKLRKGQIVISLGNPYAIARDGETERQLGDHIQFVSQTHTQPF